jgi:hypothetical protein
MRLASFAFVAVLSATAVSAQPEPQLDGGFFAALGGDSAAIQAVLESTAQALAQNANDAEALVEHGFMTVFAGSVAARAGEPDGMSRIGAGMAEMDRAVALAPDNGRVRVLRGIMLQQASYDAPATVAHPMLENARSDFDRAYALQVDVLDLLGEHRLGELLQIKADIESRLALTAEAEETYRLLSAKLPNTEYAERAGEWLQTRSSLPRNKTTCIGCHVTP